MLTRAGFQIVRHAEIEWEDRVNVDGWPCRAGMYYQDAENSLTLRLIDYPVGSVEPRHVHAGTHATTVLKGYTIVDGTRLNPLDMVLGPSNEPHGPLHYVEGCQLLSAFQGSYHHSEVETLSDKKEYRLVQAEQLPWVEGPNGRQVKTLLDSGAGRLLVQVLKFQPGASVPHHSHPEVQAALVVEGSAEVEGERLGVWDLLYVPSGAPHGPISFPEGATLLAWTLCAL